MKFSSSASNDCAEIAPQLTALFDGEADDFAASQARAHLLSCTACSRLWLDWTRHRAALQSEPVVEPPPTLLWRVLIAYRVAAFAHPARHHARPQGNATVSDLASATILRELEAPLPPRLSDHILARTTRKPQDHVMLTPLDGVSPVASARKKAHSKARASRFHRVPLWAAPALALWVLMLSRTDFNATLPASVPESAFLTPSAMTQNSENRAVAFAQSPQFVPIPVLNSPVSRVAADAPSNIEPLAPSQVAMAQVATAPRATAAAVRDVASSSSPARPVRVADQTLDRALLLAMSAGRRDIARVQIGAGARTRTRNNAAPAMTPSVEFAPPAETAALPADRRETADFRTPTDVQPASARVTLAAMISPNSSLRAVSASRLRAAAFSEDSLRPRATYLSAGGRRLARALPDDSSAALRVSRPSAAAPTLREVNFGSDNGPRIEDVRSAVDEFRASVADEHFSDN